MTIVCLGGGPSLTQADVNYCRGRARILAINNAIALAPWADYLYAGDFKWWKWNNGVPGFEGQKFTVDPRVAELYQDVAVLVNTGLYGLDTMRWGIRTGGNGGYQAINLCVHLLNKEEVRNRIVLLGYDMQSSPDGDHWHAPHPDGSHPRYENCIRRFETLVAPLADLSIEVVNCSPTTALRAFPCRPLSEILPL